MTDTTAARRALLALLLDRVDRGTLLEPEKPLLRCLVAAEQGAADTPTTDDDARPWIADALGLDVEASWAVIADTARTNLHHLATTNDTLGRVRELAERWAYVPGLKDSPRTSLLRAIDGPSPTPDDAQAVADQRRLFQAAAGLSDSAYDDGPTGTCRVMETRTCPPSGPCGDQPCARFESEDPTPWLPEQPAGTSNVTDWATPNDEQCPARYTGDSPHLTDAPGESVDYRCERRGHGLDSVHAMRQGGDVVFCWADAIAVYPLDDAPSEPQP